MVIEENPFESPNLQKVLHQPLKEEMISIGWKLKEMEQPKNETLGGEVVEMVPVECQSNVLHVQIEQLVAKVDRTIPR